jgi:hypothetical protein
VGHSFGQNQWQACSCAQIEATTDVGEPGLLSATWSSSPANHTESKKAGTS